MWLLYLSASHPKFFNLLPGEPLRTSRKITNQNQNHTSEDSHINIRITPSQSESEMKITHQITNQIHESKSQIKHSESETQIEPQTKIRITHHNQNHKSHIKLWITPQNQNHKSHIKIRITITNTNQQLGSEAKRNEYFMYRSGNRMQVCDIQHAFGRLTSQATGRGGLLVASHRKEPSLMKGVLGRLEISN